MRLKKAQEEMTGFAMIIIIVAIIGVILLAFMLRKSPGSNLNSFEVQQFLDTAIKTQSSCTLELDNTPLRLADLIQACYSNSANTCKSGRKVCASLGSSFKDIIMEGWNINPNAPYTGFILDLYLEPSSNSSSVPTYILNASGGSCNNNYLGAESILPEKDGAGNLITRLQICLSNSTS